MKKLKTKELTNSYISCKMGSRTQKVERNMVELEERIKDVKEFAGILKTIKGTSKEYKEFTAGAIAGVRMAYGMAGEKKAG